MAVFLGALDDDCSSRSCSSGPTCASRRRRLAARRRAARAARLPRHRHAAHRRVVVAAGARARRAHRRRSASPSSACSSLGSPPCGAPASRRRRGATARSSTRSSRFHGLHVVVGLVGLVLTRARASSAGPSWRRFWHFVGAALARALLGALSRRLPAAASEHAQRGRVAYQHYCRPCHGDAGDGHGLRRRPACARRRATSRRRCSSSATRRPARCRPTRSCARIVRHGLNGTAMRPSDMSARELDRRARSTSRPSRRAGRRSSRPRRSFRRPIRGARPARREAIARGGKMLTEKGVRKLPQRASRAARRPSTACAGSPASTRRSTIASATSSYRELPPDLRCDPLRIDLRRHASSAISIASSARASAAPRCRAGRARCPRSDLWSLAYYIRAIRRDQTGCNLSRTGQ